MIRDILFLYMAHFMGNIKTNTIPKSGFPLKHALRYKCEKQNDRSIRRKYRKEYLNSQILNRVLLLISRALFTSYSQRPGHAALWITADFDPIAPICSPHLGRLPTSACILPSCTVVWKEHLVKKPSAILGLISFMSLLSRLSIIL